MAVSTFQDIRTFIKRYTMPSPPFLTLIFPRFLIVPPRLFICTCRSYFSLFHRPHMFDFFLAFTLSLPPRRSHSRPCSSNQPSNIPLLLPFALILGIGRASGSHYSIRTNGHRFFYIYYPSIVFIDHRIQLPFISLFTPPPLFFSPPTSRHVVSSLCVRVHHATIIRMFS